MTDTDHDDTTEYVDSAWADLETGLADYLADMTGDGEDGDHLLIEVTDPDPEGDDGSPPYAQFAVCGAGRLIRAEVTGDHYLRRQFRLGADGARWFARRGWSGGVVGESVDADERNWHVVAPTEHAGEVAAVVVSALRRRFGIVHPQLLSYRAWGPGAELAADIGLCATDEIPLDEPTEPVRDQLALMPADRDELVGFVARLLREKYESEPTIDDDGDFVLHHLGRPVWGRVRSDQPAVEIIARVAHDVRSRRATAVEIGILNRDSLWVGWELCQRTVWQTLAVPGVPFVPSHLDSMLDVFLDALTATRDDLALRIGAKVA